MPYAMGRGVFAIIVMALVVTAIPASVAGRTAGAQKRLLQKCAAGRTCTTPPRSTHGAEGKPARQTSAPYYPCLFYMC
jgi:hypothetical protein